MIENTISSRLASLVWETALRAGVCRAQLAGGLGVDAAVLGDDLVRVPTESAWRMWELLYAAVGHRSGLRVAATATRGRLTVWDYLFTSGATLAESLRTVTGMRAVVADPRGGAEVIVSGGLLTVRDLSAVEPGPILGMVDEFTLSVMLQRAREATGQHLVPIRVSFRHAAPREHRHLKDVFGTGRIEFDAPYAEMTFLDAAELPTGSDPELGRIHRRHAELLLVEAKLPPHQGDRVRMALHEAVRGGEYRLEQVAQRLSISPRTLQRRLREQGTSWRDEVDAIRHEQAAELLRETDLPIRSIATRLGYTDPRALQRAFQRQTGRSPGEFRRAGEDPSARRVTGATIQRL